jgi:hypothetical protein
MEENADHVAPSRRMIESLSYNPRYTQVSPVIHASQALVTQLTRILPSQPQKNSQSETSNSQPLTLAAINKVPLPSLSPKFPLPSQP